MKRFFLSLLAFVIIFINGFFVSLSMASSSDIAFTKEELNFIDAHQNETFLLGLDPYSGMDYFEFKNKKTGFLLDVLSLIKRETKLNIKIASEKSWGEALNGLSSGDIDILFGANSNIVRKKYMNFTRPIIQYPYAVFAKKGSSVQTLGDLDAKKVAFIDGDVNLQPFLDTYNNIHPKIRILPDQNKALDALSKGEVDGFVVSGGVIIHDFIYNHSDLNYIAEINTLTSDMTFSTLKENAVLVSILDKIIGKYLDNEIKDAIENSEVLFTRKILRLTPAELAWLDRNEEVKVGVADDYLPFDYYADGKYQGVAGSVFGEISRLIGLNVKAVHGDFDEIYDKALDRQIDVVNMAKTPDRLNFFYFPQPFSYERDQIYGRSESPHVQDIYGLEDKKVAVIDGFWHREFLLKNLRNVSLIRTKTIEESIDMVNKKQADYFIENPTVADFYIQGLDYRDIVLKGSTSSDSSLYFGVSKNKPELYSIIDKTISLISYEELKHQGLSNVPELIPIKYKRLTLIITLLTFSLFFIAIFTFRTLRILANEKAKILLLSERTKLLYTDPLTGLKNRTCFKHMEDDFDSMSFPQIIIMADMNDLKTTNDLYGHHMGDLLIKQCSEILNYVFQGCHIFRMGGDEFLLVCPYDENLDVEDQIDSVNRIASTAIITDGKEEIIGLCIAMGASHRKNIHDDFNAKMIEADNKMYIHKKHLKKNSCKK